MPGTVPGSPRQYAAGRTGCEGAIKRGHALFAAFLVTVFSSFLADAFAQETGPEISGQTSGSADAIFHCMKQSREAVLLPEKGVRCVIKGEGTRLLARSAPPPYMIDITSICKYPRDDKRVLDGYVIRGVRPADLQPQDQGHARTAP